MYESQLLNHLTNIADFAKLNAENRRLREFICHYGGLINEWANEHKTGTLTEYIEHKLDAWLEMSDD